ncbi:MAG TPA: hypothetical protein VK774_06575 [Solirubrobacteraceae bacterium]|nr:hypothetical protein [Solirubrobacteraceae bacterium]
MTVGDGIALTVGLGGRGDTGIASAETAPPAAASDKIIEIVITGRSRLDALRVSICMCPP